MTFQRALAAIQRSYPAGSVGLTARQGAYYDRAQPMDFRPCGSGQFRARGPNEGLGTNPKRYGYRLISCGPKG